MQIAARSAARQPAVAKSDVKRNGEGFGLNRLPVDDEARQLGDLVVEFPRGPVGLVRLPVHARGSGNPCLLAHPLDQRTADALAAR